MFFRIDSLDAFKFRRAEVDEQPVFDAGRAQVVDQLRDVDWGDLLVVHAGESVSLTLHVGIIPSSLLGEWIAFGVWGLGRSPNSKNLCASLCPLCGKT